MQDVVTDLSKWPPRRAAEPPAAPEPEPVKARAASSTEPEQASSALRWRSRGR